MNNLGEVLGAELQQKKRILLIEGGGKDQCLYKEQAHKESKEYKKGIMVHTTKDTNVETNIELEKEERERENKELKVKRRIILIRTNTRLMKR